MDKDQTAETELSFIERIRKAVAPECESPRTRRDYNHIFSSTDDRRIMDRITSRTGVDRSGLSASFKENGIPLNLKVHKSASFDDAGDIICELVDTLEPEFGQDKFIVQHDHEDIRQLNLWKKFGGKAVQLVTTFEQDLQLREKTVESFIGITAADWGIAESATLLQFTKPGCPRSTSLVPSIHIGIVREENILSNLQEAYCMIRRNRENCGLTLISGPSKTADIEAHMVHGAHGPKEMHVIIVSESDKTTQ